MNTAKKTMNLGRLATIRSGHPFRGKVENTPSDWDFYVLRLKDVQKDCEVDFTEAARVKMTDKKPPQPLQAGDILLRARGGYYYSGLFSSDKLNVLAAGQFFVLRPKTDLIDPAYLCWLLNQPAAQRYLQQNDTGSNISMISKRIVSDLPVALPSLPTQRKVAKLHQNWLKEKQLTEQLLENRKQIVRGMCQQYINQP